ncbi:MAG: IS4 family transposase [Phycisphaerae bacterium]
MNTGRIVFSQVMDHLPMRRFATCVNRYDGDQRVRTFSCRDQFYAMAFAQLTFRESLRDIIACLTAMNTKLYHMGIRGRLTRSTLADANQRRHWRIYADFALLLIQQARRLYADQDLPGELSTAAYALDSTTIDLSLTLFPWAQVRRRKSAVKLHTLLDLQGSIPRFVHVTGGQTTDNQALDHVPVEPGAFYVMDRGYFDLARLFALHQARALFVVRAINKMQFRRIYSRPVDKATGLQCDQIIRLTGPVSKQKYPDSLRRVRFYDADMDKRLVFITNDFSLPALAVAELYKQRWQIELFFKWLKQHLRIKAFYGTTVNAVKTQVWIAVAVYVLIAILKKRLLLEQSLYTILQVLSVTLFEKTPISQVFSETVDTCCRVNIANSLPLFDF